MLEGPVDRLHEESVGDAGVEAENGLRDRLEAAFLAAYEREVSGGAGRVGLTGLAGRRRPDTAPALSGLAVASRPRPRRDEEGRPNCCPRGVGGTRHAMAAAFYPHVIATTP